MSTVKLSKPITAHGDQVSELTLRQPTVEDLMELGSPTLLVPSADGSGVGVDVRPAVVARYVSRLAAIPMGSVKALSMADFQQCTGVVMGFFNGGDGETA